MPVRVTVDRANEPMPAFDFHWDAETEILAGRHPLPVRKEEHAVTWECKGHQGAVAVLETEQEVF